MGTLVSYRLEGSVATIAMDDGKRNALSLAMIEEVGAAFDRAADDRAVVVLTGREGTFSAGFDLPVLRAGKYESLAMIRAGFELAERILAFPHPVVVACNGHAFAMGAFLLCSGDYRIGTAGPYKIATNEVAIGIAMPRAGVEICRQRLAPAHFTRAALLAEVYAPEGAVEAGFLDRVVAEGELSSAAMDAARGFVAIDARSHATTKLRVRAPALRAIRAAIHADMAQFVAMGVRRLVSDRARSGR